MTTAGTRVGIGHDTHRLAEGGPLRLGGIDIPHSRHAVGHSDADVLLHALVDALLGAAALGDIGQMFPNSDLKNLNRDSREMLAAASQRVTGRGYEIANIDAIVFAEQPKLSSYYEALRTSIADVLAIDVGQVSVKAKTGEAVGPVGRQEAIEAQCVVLLEKAT